MAIIDLTKPNTRANYPPPVAARNSTQNIKRRITGAELTAAGTPASDTFRVFQLQKGMRVRNVELTVLVVDTTGVTSMDIGYEDSNGSSATAFEANATLAATGCFSTGDAKVMLSADGWITITPNNAILAGCVFVLGVDIDDYGMVVRDDTIAAAIST